MSDSTIEALTPTQTSGPLFGFALMFEGSENAVDPNSPGAIRLHGTILDGDGEPLAWPDGYVEVWHGEQYARTRTDADGRWHAVIARPDTQILPDGAVLAPHVNVVVFARGLLKQAHTRMYFPDEAEANANDPVFALVDEDRRETLLATTSDDGFRFDIRLQGADETVFFAL